MELTRRNFIAGAAALAGGAVGLGALAGCSSNEASSDAWDEEADVVVVGGGTGQLAALAAAQAGLSVILVEKREMVGGAMAFRVDVPGLRTRSSRKQRETATRWQRNTSSACKWAWATRSTSRVT